MRWVFLFFGGGVLAYGVFALMVMNLNLGVMLTLALGAALALTGIFYDPLLKLTGAGALKYVKYGVIFLFCAYFVLVAFLWCYGSIDSASFSEDACVVLGAGLRGERVSMPLKLRLDAAIEYHGKNPDALIVVSGGQGLQETVTEAYAMEKYLVEHGVLPDKIVKEERSTSTNENMRFSKEILDGILAKDYSITVITNDFHIYRGVYIAHLEGFENVSHFHAPLRWYNMLPCYLREVLAVAKMWVMG